MNTTPAPRARILAVDDNPTNLELVRYLLHAAGFDVATATGGADALAQARLRAPDLVITDLQMPGMDGHALLQALRHDPALRHVPVMALTAASMAGEEERVRGAGFDAYLSKPFEPEDFALQITTLLRSLSAPSTAVPHR